MRGEIAGARLDLMEQVRQLLQDKDVHPAAPIVLCGAALEIAKRNTRRLFQAGILLGVASEGGDPVHETELLVEAGLTPEAAIQVATANGAAFLWDRDIGRIEAGYRADLVIVPLLFESWHATCSRAVVNDSRPISRHGRFRYQGQST